MEENAKLMSVLLNKFHHIDSLGPLICYIDYIKKNIPVKRISDAVNVKFTPFCHKITSHEKGK
jgi:hypothetical protein